MRGYLKSELQPYPNLKSEPPNLARSPLNLSSVATKNLRRGPIGHERLSISCEDLQSNPTMRNTDAGQHLWYGADRCLSRRLSSQSYPIMLLRADPVGCPARSRLQKAGGAKRLLRGPWVVVHAVIGRATRVVIVVELLLIPIPFVASPDLRVVSPTSEILWNPSGFLQDSEFWVALGFQSKGSSSGDFLTLVGLRPKTL